MKNHGECKLIFDNYFFIWKIILVIYYNNINNLLYKMNKLLLVEDDRGIAKSLKLYLENSDFEVFLHESWEDAIKMVHKYQPDLLILDINLPVKNGIEITKEIRETSNLPIVMLTARSSEMDRIVGLEIGADDYIPKPFSPRELLARINTILRRSKTDEIKEENSNTLQFKNIKIDTSRKQVFLSDVNIGCTGNEYDILKKLFEEDWKIVSRETIMTEIIWYDNYIYDRTIDTHIKNLRRKLSAKDIILTIRWEWYRLNK